MSELRYFDVPNFALQRSAVLPTARLAYRTLGTLNQAKDNAVLITTGITLSDDSNEMYFCGEVGLWNPRKYFIILTNIDANGRSSSPSNTPAPFEMARFPTVTHFDNIRLQHSACSLARHPETAPGYRLVDGSGSGLSVGGADPDLVAAAAPIAGSARCGVYNAVFVHSLQSALRLDPAFQNGYYTRPPIEGLRTFGAIYAGWAWSEPFFREKTYLSFGVKNHIQFIDDIFIPFFQQHDVNDLLSQTDTWLRGDISDNPIYNGDFDKALGAIKAKTIFYRSTTTAISPL